MNLLQKVKSGMAGSPDRGSVDGRHLPSKTLVSVGPASALDMPESVKGTDRADSLAVKATLTRGGLFSEDLKC